jgi:hypothetical protein
MSWQGLHDAIMWWRVIRQRPDTLHYNIRTGHLPQIAASEQHFSISAG